MKHADVIAKLNLEQKCALLSGDTVFTTRAYQKAGVPAITLSDGPNGVRKQAGAADHLGLNPSVPATCFPTAATVACSWDPALGEQIGRAISDIRAKSGSFDPPVETPGGTLLQGRAPVSELRDYARDVAAYTRGRGRLSCEVAGYFPCHNTEAVVAALAYDPAADLENTPDSVFCSHGAGITTPVGSGRGEHAP